MANIINEIFPNRCKITKINKRAFISLEFKDRKDGDRSNLNEYCQTANIVLPTKKGKAIMWYNYELDEKNRLDEPQRR